MRNDEKAELMVYCTKCGNYANEYNWTLATAAKFSSYPSQTPTLISLLLELAKEEKMDANSIWLVCPRCNEKVKLAHIPLPPADEIKAYAEKVGEEYCQFKF